MKFANYQHLRVKKNDFKMEKGPKGKVICYFKDNFNM
jgi:hypothetical protein